MRAARHQEILKQLSATGLALIGYSKVSTVGACPDHVTLQTYAKRFLTVMGESGAQTIVTDALHDDFADLPQAPALACGVAGLQLPGENAIALLFRPCPENQSLRRAPPWQEQELRELEDLRDFLFESLNASN